MEQITPTSHPSESNVKVKRVDSGGYHPARITRAADDLLAKGYILQQDRDEYIRIANAESPVPPVVPDPVSRPPDTSGCTSTGTESMGAAWLLAIGALLLLRRRRSK